MSLSGQTIAAKVRSDTCGCGQWLLYRLRSSALPTSEDAVGKPWTVPIPGTTKLHHLHEDIGAAGIELAIDDLRQISEALSQIQVQGDRYPAHLAVLAGG